MSNIDSDRGGTGCNAGVSATYPTGPMGPHDRAIREYIYDCGA
jgi:hypothetical protein